MVTRQKKFDTDYENKSGSFYFYKGLPQLKIKNRIQNPDPKKPFFSFSSFSFRLAKLRERRKELN